MINGNWYYLRDDETGELWSPTKLPIDNGATTYIARHGRGYSRFEHSAHGIALDLLQYVPLDDPIKISRLVLRNTTGRTRHLSVTAYAEWVLGPSRAVSAPHIVTEMDTPTGAGLIMPRNNLVIGGQKSVHECFLSATEKAELRRALGKVIDGRNDSVVFVRLDPRATPRTLGIAVPPRDEAFVYVG